MAARNMDSGGSGHNIGLENEYRPENTRSSLQSKTNILTLEAPEVEQDIVDGTVVDDTEYAYFDNEVDSEEEGGQDLSPGGVLDEETISQGMSNLGRTADGSAQVFLHLTIAGFSLKDISILADYNHLQRVELPYNELTDLSPLGHMPHLLELDVSHNALTSLLNFEPPKNLMSVDASFNQITEMCDLSPHHYLQKLILDNNSIREIKGIENCSRLKILSLAHNRIDRIKGVEGLSLTYFSLSSNDVKKIENLETLKYLQVIDLSSNTIRSMEGLQDHEFLESVNLEDNEVIDMTEIQHVQGLKLLREINLQRNPVREVPDYRLNVLFRLGQITDLDRKRVEPAEKVAATNMFNPPLEVMAARDHIINVVYNFLQPSRILDSTLPSIETPYPMLVLVGPQGAGKKDLALKLVEEFPDYFGYGISHCTRKQRDDEVQGKDYYFVTEEEFDSLQKMGRFIQTFAYEGAYYGLSLEAVEAIARENLACVVHMELEGVLTLKNTYFEPRYVLIMPLCEEAHERRLRDRGLYSEDQIEWAVKRGELYAEYNREHLGFFDMMIDSDDIAKAYTKLRQLIMNYLSISVPTPTQSDLHLERTNTESQIMGHDTQLENSINTGMGARTWSKPSLTETPGARSKLRSAGSPLGTPYRGAVEEASYSRRKSAAKEAVSGTRPTLFEQVAKTPKTVPQSVDAQVGLEEDIIPSGRMDYRSYSAPANPNMDEIPPGSPDSSDMRSNGSSSLSNFSAHIEGERGAGDEGADYVKDSQENLALPSEALDRLELMSGSASKTHSGGPMPPAPLTPRPGSALSGSRPGSNSGSRPASRPGSERHPVLPPIRGGSAPVEPLPAF